MDAVGGLGRLQGLLPAATRLVELVEEVEALAAPVQLLCLLLSHGTQREVRHRAKLSPEHSIQILTLNHLLPSYSMLLKTQPSVTSDKH